MHWLKEWRLNYVHKDGRKGMSRLELACKVRNHNTGCSETLIAILEGGGITHPGIADRIAAVTGATQEQRDSIVHKRHRGKWAPKKIKQYSDFSSEGKKPQPMTPGYAPVNAREVVQIDKHGFEIGRFDSMSIAAANAGCSLTTVRNRCIRAMSRGTNEFYFYGCTFRFADEWDKMNLEQRRADLCAGVQH